MSTKGGWDDLLDELSKLIYEWYGDSDTSIELIDYINDKSTMIPEIPLQTHQFEFQVDFKVSFQIESELPADARNMNLGQLEVALAEELVRISQMLEDIEGYPDVSVRDIEVLN